MIIVTSVFFFGVYVCVGLVSDWALLEHSLEWMMMMVEMVVAVTVAATPGVVANHLSLSLALYSPGAWTEYSGSQTNCKRFPMIFSFNGETSWKHFDIKTKLNLWKI